MTITSELNKLQTNLSNAYSAVSNKGGTLPASQNFDNLSAAINSISGGGGGSVIESLTITPSTSSQTITASGGVNGYSPITVNAVTSSIDNQITANHIRSGVTILGVTGTFAGGTTEYSVVLELENLMNGTSDTQAEVEEEACDDLSNFLFGTNNS